MYNRCCDVNSIEKGTKNYYLRLTKIGGKNLRKDI